MKTQSSKPKQRRSRRPTTAADRAAHKYHQRLIGSPQHPQYLSAFHGHYATTALSWMGRYMRHALVHIVQLHDANDPRDNFLYADWQRYLAFSFIQLALMHPYRILSATLTALQARPQKYHVRQVSREVKENLGKTWRTYTPPTFRTYGITQEPKHEHPAIRLLDMDIAEGINVRPQVLELLAIQNDVKKIANQALDFDHTIIPDLERVYNHFTKLMQRIAPTLKLHIQPFDIYIPEPLQGGDHEKEQLILEAATTIVSKMQRFEFHRKRLELLKK